MGGRASQYIKALADGAKIHPNELLGGMGGPGNIYFVIPTTATYRDVLARDYDFVNNDGSNAVQDTLELAYAKCVSNRNDLILLYASNVVHEVAAMVTVAKNRVNIAGWDLGGDRRQGQGARVYMGVTGAAADLAPILNTGNRNTFRNMKVENASTTNESLYGFIDNGENTLIRNLHTLKTAGLNDANHAHFWLAGDSLDADYLTVGQSNTPNTAAGFGILIDAKTGGGSDAVKENFLSHVLIKMSVGGSVQATSCFIKIADNAAMNFDNVMEDVTGSNFVPVGGSTMDDAVLGAASTTSGALHLKNFSFFGADGNGGGSGYGVYIHNSPAGVAAGGLGVEMDD